MLPLTLNEFTVDCEIAKAFFFNQSLKLNNQKESKCKSKQTKYSLAPKKQGENTMKCQNHLKQCQTYLYIGISTPEPVKALMMKANIIEAT